MADQNQNDRNTPLGDENDQSSPDQRKQAGSTRGDEQDDVAEDRNLSGSSTWLNLPDQQTSSEDDSSDESPRSSNR
ncbi:MAG TPA: hypothetical protein VH277_03745 [Gemmatimonadaceae bacterium]|jgi:hypothetical protein|nr:hypothetical protein [Gemmatimonadaceae bacterium]